MTRANKKQKKIILQEQTPTTSNLSTLSNEQKNALAHMIRNIVKKPTGTQGGSSINWKL